MKTAHQPLFSALRLLSGIQSRAILCTSVLPFACCIRVAPDLLAKELEFALFAGALISHSSKTGPVLQVVPDSPGILISKGLAEQETGDWNAALCHFQQATHLDPQNAIAFRLMGDALARLGSWADARASYDLSIVLDPACADAYNNLGIALLEL